MATGLPTLKQKSLSLTCDESQFHYRAPLICASLMGLNGIWVCDLNVCLPVGVVASPFPFSTPFYLYVFIAVFTAWISGIQWSPVTDCRPDCLTSWNWFAIIWKHSHQIHIVKLNLPVWHWGLSASKCLLGVCCEWNMSFRGLGTVRLSLGKEAACPLLLHNPISRELRR